MSAHSSPPADQSTKVEFSCVECNWPVFVDIQIAATCAHFICQECEQKQDDEFWEAIHG